MASAGTDEDPASAIGVIRPDQRIQGRAEDTADEEQPTEPPARGEEAAQVPVTVTDAPPIAPEEPSAAAEATTETDEIGALQATSGLIKSGARRDGLPLFLSSSLSMSR